MWLLFVFGWAIFLAAVAIVAQQAFGYDLSRAWTHFLELPPGQRLATGTIAVMALALMGVSIFLSRRMSHQEDNLKLLRTRLKVARDDMVVATMNQQHRVGQLCELLTIEGQVVHPALARGWEHRSPGVAHRGLDARLVAQSHEVTGDQSLVVGEQPDRALHRHGLEAAGALVVRVVEEPQQEEGR